MANKVFGTPVQVALDIETTGVGSPKTGLHFLESSILEIGMVRSGQEGESLVADPASERMSTWAHRTVWEPLKRKRAAIRQTEEEILRRFLVNLKKLPDGSELIGWNIGYSPHVMGAKDVINYGYDIPGIATRAANYGMDREFQEELRRLKLRDIGQEFSVKMTRGIHRKIGQKGVSELVSLGLLDPTIAKTRSIDVTKNYLDTFLGKNIDIPGILKSLSPEDRAKIKPSNNIEDILAQLRTVTGRTDLSSGPAVVREEILGQSYGHYKKMLATELFAGRGTQSTASAMAKQGISAVGWAQETVQKTLMEHYGESADNPLVQAYMRRNNVSAAQALAVLGSKQAHLALEDARIALALSDVIDKDIDNLLGGADAVDFLKVWGKHTQRKKLLDSVSWHGFSGERLAKILNPAEGESPLLGAFKSKDEFLNALAGKATEKYGGIRDWKVELLNLKEGEVLEHKFNLHDRSRRPLSDFPGMTGKRPGINFKGKEIGAFFKKVHSRMGTKGVIAGAVAAGAIKSVLPDVALLSGISDPGSEFISNVNPYWQNTLLGLPRISGKDDNFNTIEGIGHGEMSDELRRNLTDFGSGWKGNQGSVALELADPEFSLDPSMETRRRVKSLKKGERVSQSDLLRFQRAFQYEEDAGLSSFLVELAGQMPGKDRMGSGWLFSVVGNQLQPKNAALSALYGVNLDPRVLDFRKNVLEDPDAYAAHQTEMKVAQRKALDQMGKFQRSEMFEENLSDVEGVSLRASNLRAINLKDFTMEVEDADTLILKRKGLMNVFDKPVHVRLAGIDAPEVGGHGNDPMAKWRINQEQPYGREATDVLKRLISEQENVGLLIDPTQTTYGRHVGMITGDEGTNLNLELLREGAVSALPWGSRSGDIVDRTLANEVEAEAFKEELGMWRHTRYKAAKQMGEVLGTRITHNTYTDLTKLAKNPDLAAFAESLEMGPTQYRPLSSSERSAIAGVGTNLKRAGFSGKKRAAWQKGYNTQGTTFGLKPTTSAGAGGYKLFTPTIPLTSNDDAYVNIEGLRHGGSAAAGRRQLDFGSGWQGTENLLKKYFFSGTNDTYTAFVKHRSPISDTSISSHIKRESLDKLSLEASAANRGIRQSHIATERVSQAKNTPGGKLVHSEKSLAMKEHMSYPEPARNRMSMDVPDFAEKNSVSSKNYDEIKGLRHRKSSAAAKRKNIFVDAHKKSVVLASMNGKNSGKRSRMGHGADSFVAGI